MGIDELLKEKRDQIVRIAAQHEAQNLRLFGSVARGEANPDSDVDFLIELGENRSSWFPVRLIRDLEKLLGRKIDIVTEKQLKERIRELVLQ